MRGLFGALAAPSRKSADAQTLDWLPGFLLDAASKTGISINWSTALQVTAMLACCRVVGEDIAVSRCSLMRPRSGGGFDVASDHDLHQLLYLEPSEGLTAFSLWETIVFHVMLCGNAYVFINRVGDSGRIHELLVLEPAKVQVTRLPDRTLRYDVAGEDGGFRTVPNNLIWHIRGPSWNGWMGMETVRLVREALGLSLALEGSHAELHSGGTKQSGVYAIDGELTAKQHEQMVTWLKRYAAAGDLSGAPMVLDRGAKWFNQQMSGVDTEHLATRNYQVQEVCRGVRVMPIMVGLADKVATYSSSEQMFLAHRQYTLMPWAGRLEQSGEVSLLTPADKRQGLQLRFDLDVSMRGDFKSRQEGRQIQRRNGVINANDWRAGENLNPRSDPGGDQYIVEANMAIQDGRDLPVPAAKPTTPPKEQ
ncbi:phage portal protein [Sphingomonas sp. BAUL-RG-20F-R05-02]|uniref:phage portal protein n=1 Tax=Sphingomonas sp. BAUL-RG-20F-R05-02 TaxID=2914830 RepID=UPI001F5A8694|nr:phage portal protein [Sphingomonas sp. BAUL-RG-20F-R05-02]